MVRTICITITLLIISHIPLTSLAQENGENEIVISLFENLYSFHFHDAQDDLIKLHSTNISPDLLDICNANYHWWLLVTQKNHESNVTEMISALDRIIQRYDKIPAEKLNPDAIFAVIHAYAYKTRFDLHEDNYLKGAKNLNLALKYLEIVLQRAEENPKFMLLAGLYHYLGGSILEKYPLFKPIVGFAPAMHKNEGLRLLQACSENDHPMIRTESRYFLMKVQNQLEEDHKSASKHAVKLLDEYPDNKYFRSCWVIILADNGNIGQSKKEYDQLSFRMPGDQLTIAQQNFIVEETLKDLRKKRIKF